ncbi:WXG100 family type VII secretion target [Mycolicibacterium arseniciresistens]|uniref:WXG100 family type VII secretion target n=1 Tax=Mycolicibacterium arseniciresistens TaxID=3062257 RepID=A0ABT8UL23_9MYCO|nr:WXG100 family type VII secretion target [Mycolicibacterium arseniciresistens]MDO3638461.1 WXG100 family type VII secretion target [Mycolicibacterium arseniciresistens]
MGGSVEVVVSELESAATRLADAGQRLQDGLSAVDLSVDELLAKGWKGGAATAYTAEWDNWHNGAGQVVRGLQSMSESLKAAGAQYTATDQQAAEAVGSSFQPTGGAPSGGAPSGSPSEPGAAAPAGHSAGNGAPSIQGGTGAMAEMMNLGQPAAQTGQALGQATGQLAAGLAQAAAGIAQAVTALAQQAAQADEKDDADKQDDEREPSEEGTEDRDGDEATEQPAGADGPAAHASSSAPVDAVPQPPPTAVVPTGVSRPSGAG